MLQKANQRAQRGWVERLTAAAVVVLERVIAIRFTVQPEKFMAHGSDILFG
ncbi:MAG: hypothetical protein PUI95_05585 [Eubacteriales bacterium]|nr:hypothetical protein [Eubacteriales bacterium]